MSEIDALIAISGAIDEEVLEDRDRRSQVANLVPAYRVGDRFGWYREFMQEREDVQGLPPLDQLGEEPGRVEAVSTALAQLAEPTRFASMLPRRLLAIAVASRVFRDQFGPTGEQERVALDALTVPGILTGLPPVPTPPPAGLPRMSGGEQPQVLDQALSLLTVLADPTALVRIEDWYEFLSYHADLVSPEIARLPPPCATSVIERPGDGGPIALLQTEMCVGGVDLDTVAAAFLEPEQWPGCCAWWCKMLRARPVRPGLRRYLEVVASDCDSHNFEVAVFLDFATAVDQPKRKVFAYRKSTKQDDAVDGRTANGAVDVDQGVIALRQEPSHVHVSTTKRIQFARPIPSKAVALLACWVGYGDVACDMICNCSGGRRQAVDCDVGASLTGPIGRFVHLAYRCAMDAAKEARRVTSRIGSVPYSPETAAADASRMMGLAVRAWVKVATTFVDAVGDVATPPAQSSQVAAQLPAGPFSLGQALAVGCSLSLAGPLRSPFDDVIDTSLVGITPSELGPGAREFTLAVNSAGCEGSAYTGQVVATRVDTNAEVERLAVDVIVP
jgi:hypothetical protein